jgi:hypothetical protein
MIGLSTSIMVGSKVGLGAPDSGGSTTGFRSDPC